MFFYIALVTKGINKAGRRGEQMGFGDNSFFLFFFYVLVLGKGIFESAKTGR